MSRAIFLSIWTCCLVLAIDESCWGQPPLAPRLPQDIDISDETHTVQFQPGSPERDALLQPRFSPKGTQVPLMAMKLDKVPGMDHLVGRVPVSPEGNRQDGLLIGLSRSTADKPYDQLFIDSNRNGSLADEKPITTEPKKNRDNWWSSFSTTFPIDHAEKGKPAKLQDYPVSMWAVVEKPGDTPAVIRYSRRGFKVGSVKLGGTDYRVVLADGNNDGVFGKGDSWVIVPANGKQSASMEDWRNIPDFAWSGDRAWKLTLDGTAGETGKLTPFNPGKTRAEDLVSRDTYKVDRDAPRAAKPVTFLKDYEAAIKQAAMLKQPCFLKFETDWCGPCKVMTQYVFTAKEVADAANGMVCVTIDGDKRKDLAEKYQVKGYPTGILLDADGKELRRITSYAGVKAMAKFFQGDKK